MLLIKDYHGKLYYLPEYNPGCQRMQQSKSKYIIIAIGSFFVLASVQIYLIFNMFKLQNEQYYIPEKRS